MNDTLEQRMREALAPGRHAKPWWTLQLAPRIIRALESMMEHSVFDVLDEGEDQEIYDAFITALKENTNE